jgi:hypothetical protein
MYQSNFKIIALILACCYLSSCGDQSSYAPLPNSQSENAQSTDLTTSDARPAHSTDSVAATMFRSEQVEHTGSLTVQCKNVQDYCMSINKLIAQFDGTSSEVDITTNTEHIKSIAYKADSNIDIVSVQQHGKFVFKLPKKNAQAILPELLKLDGTIIHLSLTGEDRTIEHRVTQIIDAATTSDSRIADSLGIEATASNRAQKEEIEYRAKFLWCAVDITGEATIQHIPKALLQDTRASFGNELSSSARTGLSAFRSVLLLVASIWPLLLMLLGVVAFRKRIGALLGKPKRGSK